MKKTLSIIFVLSFTLTFAQHKLKKADRFFESYNYVEAAALYDEFIKDTRQVDTEVLINVADAYYFLNDMRKAATYYERALNQANGLQEPYISRYFRSLRAVRDYEKSNEVYRSHLQKLGNQNAMKKFEEDLKIFEIILKDTTSSRYTLNNLAINTQYSDFGVTAYGEDRVVFTSARPDAGKGIYSWNQQPYLGLFVADKNEYGEISNPTLFSKEINSGYHDAAVAFSPDYTTIYFTSTNSKNNKAVLDHGRNNHFKLFKGAISNGKVIEIEELFFNSDEYSVGHPFVSADGKYLFFASDMPGGYGEADIYYVEIFEDGTYGTPKNAGPQINTSGNDFFPSFFDDKFYFSSNGHIGFGGLDIFESDFDGKKFSKPVNLGKVVNSPYDDFAIFFNKDNQTGYISSSRPGGKGDDDIYHFYRKPIPCDQFVNGSVIDKKSKEIIENVTVRVIDSLDITLATVETDSLGAFITKIPCNQKVTVMAEKEGYVSNSKEITIGVIDQEHTDSVDFELDKLEDLIVKDEKTGIEKINLETIYFEFNKAEITQDSKTVLNKAAEVMDIFPKMRIKIESHTDSRGSDDYNLKLSDLRAKSTRDYLISIGVAPERIESATGFGESQLLNHCSNGVKCSDEEHEVNRRSDFIILER